MHVLNSIFKEGGKQAKFCPINLKVNDLSKNYTLSVSKVMRLLWIITNVHFKKSNNHSETSNSSCMCAVLANWRTDSSSSKLCSAKPLLDSFYTTHLYPVFKWFGVLPMGTMCMCFVSNKNEATEALHLHSIMNQRK